MFLESFAGNKDQESRFKLRTFSIFPCLKILKIRPEDVVFDTEDLSDDEKLKTLEVVESPWGGLTGSELKW